MEAERTRTRWTYAEFARLPSEGSTRYEVIDDQLYVTPSPSPRHQRVVTDLVSLLNEFVRSHDLGDLFVSPLDVLFAEGDYVEPDLLFVRREREGIVTDRGVEGAPDLVVEVLSPSTAGRDRGIKLERYRIFGVAEYWIVDPESRTVELWRLSEGADEPVVVRAPASLLWEPVPGGAALEVRLGELFESARADPYSGTRASAPRRSPPASSATGGTGRGPPLRAAAEPRAAARGYPDMHRRPRPSVIIVREWEQQLTGSGCCGKLEGDFLGCGEDAVFRERRAQMERMGPVYRAVRERFGDSVELQVIDPRNVALMLMLLRDFWAFRVGVRAALATLFGLPKQGVVVNGRLVDRSEHPDPERIAALVDEAARGGRIGAGAAARARG